MIIIIIIIIIIIRANSNDTSSCCSLQSEVKKGIATPTGQDASLVRKNTLRDGEALMILPEKPSFMIIALMMCPQTYRRLGNPPPTPTFIRSIVRMYASPSFLLLR